MSLTGLTLPPVASSVAESDREPLLFRTYSTKEIIQKAPLV